jgi:hypothetical protein
VIVFAHREGEEQFHGLYSQEYHALSVYNAELSRGIMHTPEWDEAMAGLQARFNAAIPPNRIEIVEKEK